jgi:hypothetical protein
MSDVSQIQDDARTGLNQLLYLGSKNVSALDHQASGAAHHGGVWLQMDVKAELRGKVPAAGCDMTLQR